MAGIETIQNPIDLAVIVLYLIGMLGIGWYGYRKTKGVLEEFLVAGRDIPMWMYIPVMSTVVLGGASTIGGGGLGYEHGISGAWLVIMLGLGLIGLGFLISTKLVNLRAYSLGEVLTRRYDRKSGTIGALVTALYALTISITQVIAIGKVLQALLGYDQATMIVVAGIIVVAYTFLGGMVSVTITDFVQWIIMTVGIFVLAIPLGLMEVGGLSSVQAELDPSYFDPTAIGLETIGGFFLLYVLGIMIGQDIWQRTWTADSPETGKKGNIIAGSYCVIYGVATAFLGMLAIMIVGSGISDPELALPEMILQVVPVGFAGLILAGFISAMMSTADATLLASSTLLTNDIYREFVEPDASERRQTRVSRGILLGLGVIAIIIAVEIGGVVEALTLAYDILSGAIFVPIFGAFFWKRATWQGAFTSIIVSTLVIFASIWYYGLFANMPIILGLVASFVVFVAVSLLTEPNEEKLEQWTSDLETPPEV